MNYTKEQLIELIKQHFTENTSIAYLVKWLEEVL